MQKPIVSFYIAVEKEKFLGDGIFVKDNEIAYIEKIPIFMEILYVCRNFHEKKKFPMYATVILQYIINTSNIGDDSYFMEMDNFQEYIFIGSVFGHYFYKSGDFIYLFLIEGDYFLFPSSYRFSHKKSLKKEHDESQGYETYKYKKNNRIHRNKGEIIILFIQEYMEKWQF